MYTLKEDLVIPAGTKLVQAPERVEFVSKHKEMLISFSKDHCASIYLDEDLVKTHGEFFQPGDS